ncbi:MAG: ankyrin repeat protein [Crocinitomix sp.]|jgi:ankyrin repeat protein
MPFSANTIYFVANDKLKKELEKDPVLSYNLYWIKPGTLKDVKLPKQGLFAVTNIATAQYNDGPYIIPWDAVWSKKRQKTHFYLDGKHSEHPPKRMLERIHELITKCKTKAFYYNVQTDGGQYMHEYAWIFGKDHTSILDEDGEKRISFINRKKTKIKGDVLYLALKGVGVKTKSKTGWFEPHTSMFIWRTIRLSPSIDTRIENKAFPTSFRRSVILGDYASAKNCIANGLFPQITQGLLESASASENAKLVELMLNNGLKVENWWRGPLHVAQNKKTIALLLKNGAEINHESNPLAVIAESGQKGAVKYMISQGAKLKVDKKNSLWFSACKGGVLFLVKELFPLVDKNCDYVGDNGLTMAAENNRLKVVKWLYKKGVELQQKALTEAAKNNGLETVDWLLSNTKIDIDAEQPHERNALYEAANYDHIEMVDLLLDRGADPHKTMGSYNFSAIHTAAFSRSIPLIKRFLKAGVSINAKSNDDRTPLWIAVSFQNQEMVDFLIDAGASTDLKGGYQTTFEEMAASKKIMLKKK